MAPKWSQYTLLWPLFTLISGMWHFKIPSEGKNKSPHGQMVWKSLKMWNENGSVGKVRGLWQQRAVMLCPLTAAFLWVMVIKYQNRFFFQRQTASNLLFHSLFQPVSIARRCFHSFSFIFCLRYFFKCTFSYRSGSLIIPYFMKPFLMLLLAITPKLLCLCTLYMHSLGACSWTFGDGWCSIPAEFGEYL